MSIDAHIDINCDYCGDHLYDMDMVACKKCMKKMEKENDELREKVGALEEELANLKAEEDEA